MILDTKELSHPWLVYILLFGLSLMAIAIIFELVGFSALAGYFALYSVVTIILVGFGYIGVFSLKYMARV